MAAGKTLALSPESIAKANRRRIAAEEGARAIAEVQQQAAAVRKNMERLRALREAREAEAAKEAGANKSAGLARSVKRIKRIIAS
jgi:hypothetical protein